ncbi:toxin glutamine deamidase domain-containing protein [Enemella evansiae]|uniref:toxin glutamine deamidase domain-containing protein n=1 Tax=Enemella evansiae TaxID=2016499 RepID=UPI00117C59A2|nr:toxin glutamine deamidase domain-containing protein [Enemella evansiae]
MSEDLGGKLEISPTNVPSEFRDLAAAEDRDVALRQNLGRTAIDGCNSDVRTKHVDEALSRGWELDERGNEGTDALHGADDPREFTENYPDEYVEPQNRWGHNIEPFQDPENTVSGVNPEYRSSPETCSDDRLEPYRVNCMDCARCFEATWRGTAYEAAGRRGQENPDTGMFEFAGEGFDRMEAWAHEPLQRADAGDVRSALEEGGHGSSAIVLTEWYDGVQWNGHAYNALNHEGTVKTVDPQTGDVFDFGREIHPAFESSPTARHEVMVWDPYGSRIL